MWIIEWPPYRSNAHQGRLCKRRWRSDLVIKVDILRGLSWYRYWRLCMRFRKCIDPNSAQYSPLLLFCRETKHVSCQGAIVGSSLGSNSSIEEYWMKMSWWSKELKEKWSLLSSPFLQWYLYSTLPSLKSCFDKVNWKRTRKGFFRRLTKMFTTPEYEHLLNWEMRISEW